MNDTIDIKRRRLLGTAIAGIGALQFGIGELAHAQSTVSAAKAPAVFFDEIRQIDAGVLNVGYV